MENGTPGPAECSGPLASATQRIVDDPEPGITDDQAETGPFKRGDTIVAKGYLGQEILGVVLADSDGKKVLITPIYHGMGLELDVEGAREAEEEDLPFA
jgi:hypothetical protein